MRLWKLNRVGNSGILNFFKHIMSAMAIPIDLDKTAICHTKLGLQLLFYSWQVQFSIDGDPAMKEKSYYRYMYCLLANACRL